MEPCSSLLHDGTGHCSTHTQTAKHKVKYNSLWREEVNEEAEEKEFLLRPLTYVLVRLAKFGELVEALLHH